MLAAEVVLVMVFDDDDVEVKDVLGLPLELPLTAADKSMNIFIEFIESMFELKPGKFANGLAAAAAAAAAELLALFPAATLLSAFII